MHTSVGHDNSVDGLLIVHIHRQQLLSKRKREREKKPHNGYSDVSSSACPLSNFFIFLFFFSCRRFMHTRQYWAKKNRRRESVYVYIHIYSFVVTVGVYVCIQCEERRKAVKDTTNVSLFA